MKTNKWMSVGVFTLTTLLLVSFITKKEEPKQKKYQVIRSVNGEITEFDTLISENDKLSPTGYLDLLGFGNDQHIEIIHANSGEMVVMPLHDIPPIPKMTFTSDSMVVVEIKMCDSTFGGNDAMLWKSNMSDSNMVLIEKNIVIKTIDSLGNEVIEMQTLLEELGLNDMNWTEGMDGDSSVTIVQTIIVETDDENPGSHAPVIISNGQNSAFEFHQFDGTSNSNFMFHSNTDFTLLIVSDADELSTNSPNKKLIVDPVNTFQVYPNPSKETVNVQLNFNEAAQTQLTVTDANGKVVLKKDLGDIEGNFNYTIDVTKWNKGIYFIQIDRPQMKLVEKLVVE